MKKIFSILMLTLFMGPSINAQTPSNLVANKGQWAVFEDNKYHLTMEDVIQISKGMPYMKDGGKYKLKNEKVFWVFCPQKWVEIMKTILSKVKGTPVTDIAKEFTEAQKLGKASIIPWDDNISTKTRNYAVTNCKPWIVDENYAGGDDVEGLNYMGYMVLKTFHACINPEDPKIPDTVLEIPDTQDTPGVPDETDTVVKNGDTYVTNKYYINPTATATASVTNSGNSTVSTPPAEQAYDGGAVQTSYPLDNYRDNTFYPHGRRQQYFAPPPPPQPRFQVRARLRIAYNGSRPQQQQQTPTNNNHASGTGGFKTGNKVYNATGTRGRRS